MAKYDDMETLTNSLKCLVVFESKTESLYKDIAEKASDMPLVKSLLIQISLDGQKHAAVLKGIVQSLPKVTSDPKLPKSIDDAWRSIDAFQIELSDVATIPEEDLRSLSEQLSDLESIMAQAYDMVSQFENLELLCDALGKLYEVSFDTLKTVFMELIHDERHHKEILSIIAELLSKAPEEEVQAGPLVQFQNPDAWSRPTPSTPQF
jgi:hypothetical protein